MNHPALEQTIRVAASAVRIHERSGWELAGGAQVPAREPAAAPLADGMVTIYHPISQGQADVPASSVPTLRAAGWMLKSEWDAAVAAAPDSTPAPASAPAAGGTSSKAADSSASGSDTKAGKAASK
jgi:hypothetical protein